MFSPISPVCGSTYTLGVSSPSYDLFCTPSLRNGTVQELSKLCSWQHIPMCSVALAGRESTWAVAFITVPCWLSVAVLTMTLKKQLQASEMVQWVGAWEHEDRILGPQEFFLKSGSLALKKWDQNVTGTCSPAHLKGMTPAPEKGWLKKKVRSWRLRKTWQRPLAHTPHKQINRTKHNSSGHEFSLLQFMGLLCQVEIPTLWKVF